MNEFTSKQIVLNSYLVNYYSNVIDESPITVIFIHGWLSNSKVWFHLMHALKKVNITSYALDLPGFGESQVPQISIDNNFFVKVIEDFIQKLDLKNVVIVGHSNGGAIAVKLVNQNLTIAQKLVLIDAAGIRKKTFAKSLKNFAAKIVRPVFKIHFLKPIRVKIYKIMGAEDYINSEYLNKTYNNIIKEDISHLYKSIKLPTLIVWGKNDKATPLEFAKFINDNIENSKLEIIEGGHFPFIDKPDQVINYLINFIK